MSTPPPNWCLILDILREGRRPSPSVAELSRETHLRPRVVRLNLSNLQQRGLIDWDVRSGDIAVVEPLPELTPPEPPPPALASDDILLHMLAEIVIGLQFEVDRLKRERDGKPRLPREELAAYMERIRKPMEAKL